MICISSVITVEQILTKYRGIDAKADNKADNCVRRSRERESWPDIGDVKRKRNNLLRPWVSAKEERRKSVDNACLKGKRKTLSYIFRLLVESTRKRLGSRGHKGGT